jgi:hypothetical protein
VPSMPQPAQPDHNTSATEEVILGVDTHKADNETDVDLLGFDFLVDALVVALTEPRLLPLTIGVLGE